MSSDFDSLPETEDSELLEVDQLLKEGKSYESFALLSKLVREGNKFAQNRMGAMYVKGENVSKDLDRGSTLLKLAAAQGLAKSKYNLGVLYHIKGNFKEANKWFKNTAEQGNKWAQDSLITPERKLLAAIFGEEKAIRAVDSPVDSSIDEGLREATKDVLGSLTAREAKVLRMLFGIDMKTDHTLEEMGKQFDVTGERIRLIVERALIKLRHPARADGLRSFLDE